MGAYADQLDTLTNSLVPQVPADQGSLIALLTGPGLLQILAATSAGLRFLEGLQRGAKILPGTSAPEAGAGIDGDMYFNTITTDVFFKDAGEWSAPVRLRGANGKTPVKNVDYFDGRTPQKGIDYFDGANGKSNYQLWLEAGNQGTLQQYLTSLRAQDGGDGSAITSSATAPEGGKDSDVHYETPAAGGYIIHRNMEGVWVKIFTQPAKAIAAGSITNEQLQDDIKVGSLAAATNAFPAPDRPQLISVERFLVWLGSNVQQMILGLAALTTRVKTLEDRPVSTTTTTTGSGFVPTTSGDGTKFLNDKGQYTTPATGTGTGGGATTLTGLTDVVLTAPTAGQVLKLGPDGKWVNGTDVASTSTGTAAPADNSITEAMLELQVRNKINVATPTINTITFTRDADFAPITGGTFTLDTTGAKVGAVVFAYLGPATTAPAIPASFQLLSGKYEAGKELMYGFKVGNNGKIQYTITALS